MYQNQAAAAYLFLYFFIFLSLQFSYIKIFRHTLLRICEAQKVETWYTPLQWVDVSRYTGIKLLFTSLFISSFFFLSNFHFSSEAERSFSVAGRSGCGVVTYLHPLKTK